MEEFSRSILADRVLERDWEEELSAEDIQAKLTADIARVGIAYWLHHRRGYWFEARKLGGFMSLEWQDRQFRLSRAGPQGKRRILDYFKVGKDEAGDEVLEFRGACEIISARESGSTNPAVFLSGGYGVEIQIRRITGGSTERGEESVIQLNAPDAETAAEWVAYFQDRSVATTKKWQCKASSLMTYVRNAADEEATLHHDDEGEALLGPSPRVRESWDSVADEVRHELLEDRHEAEAAAAAALVRSRGAQAFVLSHTEKIRRGILHRIQDNGKPTITKPYASSLEAPLEAPPCAEV